MTFTTLIYFYCARKHDRILYGTVAAVATNIHTNTVGKNSVNQVHVKVGQTHVPGLKVLLARQFSPTKLAS